MIGSTVKDSKKSYSIYNKCFTMKIGKLFYLSGWQRDGLGSKAVYSVMTKEIAAKYLSSQYTRKFLLKETLTGSELARKILNLLG